MRKLTRRTFVAVPLLAAGGSNAAEKFKPFKLKTLDGEVRTLDDVRGKATLVGFFFPGCKYCTEAVPAVQALADKYKDHGLAAVWINVVPEQDRQIAGWLTKHSFRVPILRGGSQAALQRDYRITITPAHFLLDQSAQVVFRRDGYSPGAETEIENRIRQALAL